MKGILNYSLLFAISALAVNCETTTPSASSSSVHTTATPVAQSKYEKCVQERHCTPGDVNCLAICVGVPNPSKEQTIKTTECVAKCDKNDVAQYKICVHNCIESNFMANNLGNSSSSSTAATQSSDSTSSGHSSASSSSSSSTAPSSSPSSSDKDKEDKDHKSGSAPGLMIPTMAILGALSVALAMI
ncbi:hypothetical protein K493DRAFT_319958 [Basidiobolus meristosporus CBS 931.73]|uniref:Extracellular membrane protein CFEM domain-containing protein n=1 Tax=Basidiobolus meristosporus CBS 931.73 TaxID=1314790 RepID=A0A1Y1XJC0_9FUNG|nr:hypothetical protein K493DRAFT_319958 [Basidiobolus meristosporus CBS 931.73]|eukprot:ORX85506.1 hypothetical protein K493DRAFT_319958 [Basidiobolus meristosporus CBS 931.73]